MSPVTTFSRWQSAGRPKSGTKTAKRSASIWQTAARSKGASSSSSAREEDEQQHGGLVQDTRKDFHENDGDDHTCCENKLAKGCHHAADLVAATGTTAAVTVVPSPGEASKQEARA